MKCAECNKEASYCISEEETGRMSGFVTAWKFLCKKHFEESQEDEN